MLVDFEDYDLPFYGEGTTWCVREQELYNTSEGWYKSGLDHRSLSSLDASLEERAARLHNDPVQFARYILRRKDLLREQIQAQRARLGRGLYVFAISERTLFYQRFLEKCGF